MVIPVPAQNSCIREYVAKNNGLYILPPLESYYENCYHQLFGLLAEIPTNSTIIMYSLSILPILDSVKMSKIRALSIDKNLNYAFVLENFESSLNDEKFNSEALSYNVQNLRSDIESLRCYLYD
jgi:sporadic carbohydrate cluster protein (TIGR04323 family)